MLDEYLSTFDEHAFDYMPVLWGEEAKARLGGSAVGVRLREHERGMHEQYLSLCTALKEQGVSLSGLTSQRFAWAQQFVQSRGFTSLAAEGPCRTLLVPFIDMVNHANTEKNVLLEVRWQEREALLRSDCELLAGEELLLDYAGPDVDVLDIFERFGFLSQTTLAHSVELMLEEAYLLSFAKTARNAAAMEKLLGARDWIPRSAEKGSLLFCWVGGHDDCPLARLLRCARLTPEELERLDVGLELETSEPEQTLLGSPVSREADVRIALRDLVMARLAGSVGEPEGASSGSCMAGRVVDYELRLLHAKLAHLASQL